MPTLSTVGNSLGERLATMMGNKVVVLWSPSAPPPTSQMTSATASGSSSASVGARASAALWDGAEPAAVGSRASVERRYAEA
jgi:hypothetical protein